MGLHPDPRRPEERRPLRRLLDDRADVEGPWCAARAGTADGVADVLAGALGRDRRRRFLHNDVWTWRGLVTYYTVFVIDLASRRVHIAGSTRHPDDLFMHQVVRTLTAADDGALVHHGVLICDRDAKWSAHVRARLGDAGIRVVQTPYQAPNANAYAERFVRSIKQECLNRVIPLGERHLRRTIAEFVDHYHQERNHQGLDNELIAGTVSPVEGGQRIRRRQRLGGLLNYYARAA